LFRGDNWYHKPATTCDLCAKHFWKLPEDQREAYVNVRCSSDLGNQQDDYVLDKKEYFGRCDKCRKGVYVGHDWYHKPNHVHDLCAVHWRELPEHGQKEYANIRTSSVLGEDKIQYMLPEENMVVSERDLIMCAFDVEGTLMPEAWLALQQKTGIEGLKMTTAHEPDYNKLMRYRCDLLRKHNIKLKDMLEVVKDLKPLPGAREFLEWLKPLVPRILLLTDTFEEYAMPMFEQLGFPSVFCNSLIVDEEGFIVDHVLRLKDQKRKAVESFQRLNFRVIAVGDSFNDISMMTAAERGILIYPSDKVKKAHPEFPVAKDHYDLRIKIGRILSANKQIMPRELAVAPPLSATESSRTMWLLVCNVASFLAPEPWPAVQEKTGIAELKVTTAQEPDYKKLMALRASALRSHGVKLRDIIDVMDSLEVLPGAVDFMEWLKPILPRAFMVTDCFEEYALPIFDKLGHPMVFCNFLEADRDGFMNKLITRLPDQKLRTVEELQRLNFRIIAVGNSFNDVQMLHAAERGILYNPSQRVKDEHPDIAAVANHEELKTMILEIVGGKSEPAVKKARTA
jgi:phosphoserine/homoserine phosphotransferase